MGMESRVHENFNYINGFSLDDDNTLPIFDQFPNHTTTGYRFRDEPLDLTFLDAPLPNHDPGTFNSFPDTASQVDSSDEFSDCVSNFLNQFLNEENTDNTDPLALQAFEKYFVEDLREQQPPQPPPYLNVESPEEISFGEYSTHSSTSGGDPFETKSFIAQTPLPDSPPFSSTVNVTDSRQMVHNIFTNQESILQFKKGQEEANKFLPPSLPLIIDLDKYNLPSKNPPEVVVKEENIDTCNSNSSDGFRARKHYHLEEDDDYEDERSSKYKQSSVYEDEAAQLSEIFDRILLCADKRTDATSFPDCHSIELPKGYSSWNPSSWRSVTNDNVDIRTLLINCAQSVASDDRQIAIQILKQIRQHASPSGNPSQRLAHVFAHGLEARLSGTGSQLYASQKAVKISAAEKLKSFQIFVNACPFKKNEVYFANRTICEAASNSSTLHIVDFGVGHGFQWPLLIKHLSERRGGPPKLRITGIDHPEAGFRPAERLEETGRRLATYCHRFKVEFEYNFLAVQNWETIRVDDLKLERNEFVAVNALNRFENLLDESDNSPRDSVLKMIREMKPDVFVHSVVNGSYNAPFFVTRFKEALFHYSALFDMFDATLDRGNVHRANFEREFLGHSAVNVIACEGRERVERPEGYKQWQMRNMRAGFKGRGIDRELVKELKSKVKVGYHKDFVVDEDGTWMLQGWKGRILCGISCWVPA